MEKNYENLVRSNKGKGHKNDDSDRPTKKKVNFILNKSKTKWMNQQPSGDKISQSRGWNGSQWWCCRPKKKGKYYLSQYYCHRHSAFKRKSFFSINKK